MSCSSQRILLYGSNESDMINWTKGLFDYYKIPIHFQIENSCYYLTINNPHPIRYVIDLVTEYNWIRDYQIAKFVNGSVIILLGPKYEVFVNDIKNFRSILKYRFPYTIIQPDQIGLPEFIDQEVVDWFNGIEKLRKLRLQILLKEISYKYWYQVLDNEGCSRMCVKDTKDLNKA